MRHTPAQKLLAALVKTVPKAKHHLIGNTSDHALYEYITTFGEDALAEGVTVHLMDDGRPNRLWLSGIESKYRHKGHATQAILHVCKLADKYSVSIAAHALAYDPEDDIIGVNPNFDESYPTTKQLVTWYEQFGFLLIGIPENDDEESIMIERYPKLS